MHQSPIGRYSPNSEKSLDLVVLLTGRFRIDKLLYSHICLESQHQEWTSCSISEYPAKDRPDVVVPHILANDRPDAVVPPILANDRPDAVVPIDQSPSVQDELADEPVPEAGEEKMLCKWPKVIKRDHDDKSIIISESIKYYLN